MNQLLIAALLTTISGSLPLIFVGYQIAVNNKRHWINGVDQSKLSNPEGFAKYVGHSLTISGVLIAIISLLLYVQVINYIGFSIALMIVCLLPLPCFFIAKQKYA